MTSDALFDVDAEAPATEPPHIVSARVSGDLRRELEAERDRAGDEDLSATVRRLLRAGLRAAQRDPLGVALEDGRERTRARVFGDLDERPPTHAHGPATEVEASRLAWPRAGTARRRLLGYLYAAGGKGATSADAVAAVGYSGQRRLHDLKRGGWVEVLERDGQPVRRPTPRGAPADVYVLTADAHRRIEAEARA